MARSSRSRANFDAADEIASPAATALMEMGDEEGLDELDDCADLFRATINKINTDEQNGLLDPDTADQLRGQAVQDYEEMIDDLVDEDSFEEEDEMMDYSTGSTLATFSAGNRFGAALQQLATDEFVDPDEAIYEIAEHTGYEPEYILGLITGEYVPDEELASEIAEVFDTTATDENAYNGLLALGEEARGGDEDDNEEGDEETENFSRYLADKDRRIQDLEAEFASAKTEHLVSERLMELEQTASCGVREGWFPPIAYKEMFAEFNSDKDKLAAFSSVCQKNQVDLETELYATEKVLSLFERCGQQISFGAAVEEQLSDSEIDELDEVVSQAERNFQLRKQRTSNIYK